MGSEFLYNIKVTYTNLKDPQQNYYRTTITSTFTDLHDAKDAARSELLNEGYSQSDFKSYDINDGSKSWEDSNGLIVRAVGPGNEKFSVVIEAVPNLENITSSTGSRILAKLYHVLQTNIDYGVDDMGGKRETIVENTCLTLKAARARALVALLDGSMDKEDYEEYSEYPELVEGVDLKSGDEVIVHATRGNGMNILVSVLESPRIASS
jgi:hypothetical protein